MFSKYFIGNSGDFSTFDMENIFLSSLKSCRSTGNFVAGYFTQKNEAFQLSILNGGFINLSSSSLYISRPILKSGTLKIDLKVASNFY
jgi:hypothetical protein